MYNIIFICGKQGVGKTTLALSIIGKNSYYSLNELKEKDTLIALKPSLDFVLIDDFVCTDISFKNLISISKEKLSVRKPYSTIIENFDMPTLIVCCQTEVELDLNTLQENKIQYICIKN